MSAFEFYTAWFFTTWGGLLNQHKFSAEWDSTLNMLIDKHWQTAESDGYTVKLGPVEVWIANSYYAYGNGYFGEITAKQKGKRPSLKTMFRLARLVRHLERESCNG